MPLETRAAEDLATDVTLGERTDWGGWLNADLRGESNGLLVEDATSLPRKESKPSKGSYLVAGGGGSKPIRSNGDDMLEG
jgi:hypothetical protein